MFKDSFSSFFVSSPTSLLIFCGICTINIEPVPNCDCTFIEPPIISTIALVIARPRPVPSAVVFFSTSNLSNLVNNLFIYSAFIPLPVSLQVIIIFEMFFCKSFIHFTFKFISPASVYLIAFVSKLLTISLTLPLSPINSKGISSAISSLKSICLSPILVAVTLHILVISSLKL